MVFHCTETNSPQSGWTITGSPPTLLVGVDGSLDDDFPRSRRETRTVFPAACGTIGVTRNVWRMAAPLISLVFTVSAPQYHITTRLRPCPCGAARRPLLSLALLGAAGAAGGAGAGGAVGVGGVGDVVCSATAAPWTRWSLLMATAYGGGSSVPGEGAGAVGAGPFPPRGSCGGSEAAQ